MKIIGDIGEELTIASSRDIKLKIGGIVCYLTKNGKLIQSDKLNFKETNDVESESRDGVYVQDGECYIKLKGSTYQIGGTSANLKVQFVDSVSNVDTSSSDSLIIDKSDNSLHFLINKTLQRYEVASTTVTSDSSESNYELPKVLNTIADSFTFLRKTLKAPYYLQSLGLRSSEIFSTTSDDALSITPDITTMVHLSSKPFVGDDNTPTGAVQSVIDNLNELQGSESQDDEVTIESLPLNVTPLLLSDSDTENELNLTDICSSTPYCYMKDGYVYIYYKVKFTNIGEDTGKKIISYKTVPILTPTLSAIQSQKDNGNALKYLYTLRNSIICNSKIKTENGDLDEIITKFDERISKLEETAEFMKEILERIATTVENIKESTDKISDLKTDVDTIKTDVDTIKTKLESN